MIRMYGKKSIDSVGAPIFKWGCLQRMKQPLRPHLASLAFPVLTFAAQAIKIKTKNRIHFIHSILFLPFQSLYSFHLLPSLYSLSFYFIASRAQQYMFLEILEKFYARNLRFRQRLIFQMKILKLWGRRPLLGTQLWS